MGTNGKLSRVSRVLRQNTHYHTKFLYTSTILSMFVFPAYAVESTDIAQIDKAVETTNVNGLRSTMTGLLKENKNNTAIVDAAPSFGKSRLFDINENTSWASDHRVKASYFYSVLKSEVGTKAKF